MDTPTIWVISPDPDTQRLIELNLSKRGFRTLEASPRERATLSCSDLQLIILDENSPNEPGWETVGALRKSSPIRGVPMILLLSAAPAAKRLVPLQPVRWVEKPLDMDALLALVRQSLA